MGASWSRQIETHYSLRLTADLRAWLDDEVWRRAGGAEFHEPLEPLTILDPEPGRIWGGFMLPDTLPWIGNGYGDWLCLRVDERGGVAEIVQWSHAGGGWAPVGQSLAEALLYDASRRRQFPRLAGFAAPDLPPAHENRFADWAADWLGAMRELDVPRFWREDAAEASGEVADPLDVLARQQLCRFAVARDQTLRALQSPLKARGDRALAAELGVTWEPEFVLWLFDTRRVPIERRDDVSRALDLPFDQWSRQDWRRVEVLARKVVDERSDLSWPFDLLGWSAERRGALDEAARWYARGLKASIFSDEATRLRSHWFDESFGKFGAARLTELRAHLSSDDAADEYLRLYLDENRVTLRERVAEHWLKGARTAARQLDWPRAYTCYYQAGWDLGWQTLHDFEEVLDGLLAAAAGAGWSARAAVASLHRRHL